MANFWDRFNAVMSHVWNDKPWWPLASGRSPAEQLGSAWNMHMKHDPDDPDWAEDNTSGSADQ